MTDKRWLYAAFLFFGLIVHVGFSPPGSMPFRIGFAVVPVIYSILFFVPLLHYILLRKPRPKWPKWEHISVALWLGIAFRVLLLVMGI